MLERLEEILKRHESLVAEQADPEVAVDPERSRDVAVKIAEIEPIVSAYTGLRRLSDELEGALGGSDGDPLLDAVRTRDVGTDTDEIHPRILDLERDERFRYAMIFKNYGRAAGASLEHSHSQLVALPILPRMIVSELEGSKRYFGYKDRCIFCDIIRQEIKKDVRVISSNDHFIAVEPYAPRSPFETWVLPIRHSSSYLDMDDKMMESLTSIFSEVMLRLDTCIPNLPYNFVLHTSPLRSGPLEYYHWHFEIMPKLTSIAGFEWGSGFNINPVPPEDAAKFLKEVTLDK